MLFGFGIGFRNPAASIPTQAVSLLGVQSQRVPVLIVAEKLFPVIQVQSIPLDIVGYKNTTTQPQLRLKVSNSNVTFGTSLRLSGTSPALSIATGTGALTYSAGSVPGIKIEIQTSTTFRISYNSGATWDASGVTIPAGSTYTVPGGKPAAGNVITFASGTYTAGDTYEATVATLISSEGSSYTFANATASQQPVFRHASTPGAPEARAGLYFGGAQYLTSTDSAAVSLFANDPAITVAFRVCYSVADANGTVIAAASSAGSNDKRRFGQVNTGTGREQQAWVNTGNTANGNHVSNTDPLTGTNTPHNVCWYGPGGGGSIFLETNNGSPQTLGSSVATIGTLTPNRLSIGGVHDNSADTFLTGYIYDIAVFSSQLSSGELSSWNTELSS